MALIVVPVALVVGAGLAYWLVGQDSDESGGAGVYPQCPASSKLATVERAYEVTLPKEAEQVRYCGEQVGALGGAVFEFTASNVVVDGYLTSIGVDPTEMRSTAFVYRFRTDNWPLSIGQAYPTATVSWRQFKPCSTTLRVILGDAVEERRTAYIQVACVT